MTTILAIESSCDETACAIIRNGNEILSNIVSSQINIHTLYGGVVPEVASRIHVENISTVVTEALAASGCSMDDIDAVAYTLGPGLIGSLHVGVMAAKTIAFAYHKPLVPVHHITGHIYANAFVTELKFPLMALVVSGGHTELVWMKNDYDFEVIGTTADDAIGEAYDKVARVLGLGYPGGPAIDKLAKEGHYNPDYKLPIKIFTDDYLPQTGELSRNWQRFDGESVSLFDEQKVFDRILAEGLFPEMANSFLVEMRKEELQ